MIGRCWLSQPRSIHKSQTFRNHLYINKEALLLRKNCPLYRITDISGFKYRNFLTSATKYQIMSNQDANAPIDKEALKKEKKKQKEAEKEAKKQKLLEKQKKRDEEKLKKEQKNLENASADVYNLYFILCYIDLIHSKAATPKKKKANQDADLPYVPPPKGEKKGDYIIVSIRLLHLISKPYH
jgi:hypothetical protein